MSGGDKPDKDELMQIYICDLLRLDPDEDDRREEDRRSPVQTAPQEPRDDSMESDAGLVVSFLMGAVVFAILELLVRGLA